MRLTLRTMLAHLDGILDPADADQLSKKINESEFATNLIQRIRDVTRRPRVGAPKVEGRGLGLDPNSVAEYLDNTMPPDQVPEFERVCLESDVHLAEVAACHQVLTIVLGEPAKIDPAVRERIYRVGQAGGAGRVLRVDQPSTQLEGAKPAPSSAQPTPKPTPKSTQHQATDDYFRGRRRSMWPFVSTVALAFVVTIVALLAMGRLDRSHPIYRMFLGQDSQEMADAGGTNDWPADRGHPGDVERPSDTSAAGNQPEESGETDLNREGITLPERPDRRGTTSATDRVPATPAATPDEPGNQPDPSTDPATGTPTTLPANRLRASPESRNETAEVSEPRPVRNPVSEPRIPVSKRPATDIPETPVPGADRGKPVPAPSSLTAEPSTTVGRYISDSQILASWDARAESWMRLPTDAALRSADRLLALPLFRPKVLLAPGFNVTFCGPSHCVLGPPDAQGWPSIALDYGRLAISTDGKPDSTMDFDFGGRVARATFQDVDSGLAIAVSKHLPLGSDPVTTKSQLLVVAYATKGRILWEDGITNQRVSIPAGQFKWFLDESPLRDGSAAIPDWLEVKTQKGSEDLAPRELESMVPTDRALDLSLLEKTEHRQVQVRSLAIRCLTYMDRFAPAIAALNSEAHHSYWTYYFDALQSANARSPETAAQLRAALARDRSSDAEWMDQMLWGFSPEQLAAGSGKDLVSALDHKSMDVRVLASENLRRITGRTKNFRPERPPDQMKLPIRGWHDALTQGEIVYRSPPSFLPTESK